MSSMNRPHRKKPLLSYTSVQLGVQTVNMEVDALCIKLLVHMLFLLCAHVQDVDSLILRLEPNRLQFFEYESLIFHCEGSHDSTGLKIVHRSKGELLKCQTTVTSKRSSCTIHDIFPEDSGQYWCESRDGKRSDIIHITVTDGPVILESPISVVEGEAVTLRCKHKTTSTNLSADFYKDSRFIRRSSTGNMSIPSVSKRDEGFYKCNISGGRESAESLMAVQDGPVILESPISVVEGETVTLRCRHKTNSTNLSADFYKDGRFIRRSSTGNMSISSVSKRDEGFYKCIISGGRESAESLMAVQADPVILESPISVVEGETVTLRCRHKTTSSNLSADFYKDGRLIRRSSTGNMNISGVSKRDEGFYKCSISGGRESAESLMAVQADPVILESPISVVEGEAVTLRCRHKTTSSNLSADFYKDGRLIRRSSTGNLSIPSVSKRDEGFYKCSISGGRESAESLMAVQENQGENFSSCSTPWIVMTVLSILLLLVGLLHFGKYIRNKVMLYLFTLAPQSGTAEVQTVTVEARRVAADAPSDQAMYAAITKDRTKRVTVETRRVAADAPSDQAMYAAITKDRTKREQGVSRIMTATVHSAGTNRPLTQEPLYSLIK
ncbi:Fc receptor-like protein 4 isoform X2 [Labrus mixtus]|nr:Fc receptor-like protein 4 isoform X2 [Labrus mixtus]XP_060887706.1 Fc receptor-like protein 4 isoform X2 [Labrus mixtus]